MKLGKQSMASLEMQSIWVSVSQFVGYEVNESTWMLVFDNTYVSVDTSIESI